MLLITWSAKDVKWIIHLRILFKSTAEVERKIPKALYDWETYDGWVLQTKVSVKYCAPFKRKIWSGLYDWRTYVRWLIHRNILFRSCAQFGRKIWSALYDWRIHNKWIVHTTILFQYFAQFEVNIRNSLYDLWVNGEWIFRTKARFKYFHRLKPVSKGTGIERDHMTREDCISFEFSSNTTTFYMRFVCYADKSKVLGNGRTTVVSLANLARKPFISRVGISAGFAMALVATKTNRMIKQTIGPIFCIAICCFSTLSREQ